MVSAPQYRLVGLPVVGAAAGEAERLEAHGLERDVARQDQEVGPRDLIAVLLLDRPQEAAGLVEADVVRPAVERGESLLAVAATAAAVEDTVGTGAVPGHADEQAAVVAKVGWPPILRIRHHRVEILLEPLIVEGLESGGIVEVAAERVGLGRMLSQGVELELAGPPVVVPGAAAGDVALVDGTLAGVTHFHGFRLLSDEVYEEKGGGD